MDEELSWNGVGDPDWRGPILPFGKARECPGCGRHVRVAAFRYKDAGRATRIAYFVLCPNRCMFLSGPVSPLHVAVGETLQSRVQCGRLVDVEATVDAWNDWVADLPGTDGFRSSDGRNPSVWDDATSCPACDRELLASDIFDDNTMRPHTRVGCPDHPTVGSIPYTTISEQELLKDLKNHCAQWRDWQTDHRCPVCGRDACLWVDDQSGLWRCECACDDPATCPKDVTVTPKDYGGITLEATGVADDPLLAIQRWRRRVELRENQRQTNRQRLEQNGRLLDRINRELSETDRS